MDDVSHQHYQHLLKSTTASRASRQVEGRRRRMCGFGKPTVPIRPRNGRYTARGRVREEWRLVPSLPHANPPVFHDPQLALKIGLSHRVEKSAADLKRVMRTGRRPSVGIRALWGIASQTSCGFCGPDLVHLQRRGLSSTTKPSADDAATAGAPPMSALLRCAFGCII